MLYPAENALMSAIEAASQDQVVLWARQLSYLRKFFDQAQPDSTLCSNDWISKVQEWIKETNRMPIGQIEDWEIAVKIKLTAKVHDTLRIKIDHIFSSVTFADKMTLGKAIYLLGLQKNLPASLDVKNVNDPRQLVKIAYTFRGVADHGLLRQICSLTPQELNQLNGKEIAKLSYAYACLKTHLEVSIKKRLRGPEFSVDCFERIHQRAMALTHELGNKDIVRLIHSHAHAYGKGHWKVEEWSRANEMMQEHCNKLIKPFTAKLHELKKSEFLQLFRSLFQEYRVMDKSPDLAQALASRFLDWLPSATITSDEMAGAIWLLIRSGIRDQKIMSKVESLIQDNKDLFSTQKIILIAGALVIEHMKHPISWIGVVLSKINELRWKDEELIEINMIVFLYNLQSVIEKRKKFQLTSDLEKRIAARIKAQQRHKPEPSKAQEVVAKHLKGQKVSSDDYFDISKFEEQYEFSGCFLDIVYPEMKVMVTVDGPKRFVPNTKIYKQSEMIKRELIKLLGKWTMISLPYFAGRGALGVLREELDRFATHHAMGDVSKFRPKY